MNKKSSICLIITAVLVVAAIIMSCVGGIAGKSEKGGSVIKINLGQSYKTDDIATAVQTAGISGSIHEVSRTNVEIEFQKIDEEKLQSTAESVLSALSANYPSAAIVYADNYEAIGTKLNMLNVVYAAIGFVILAFAYGWLRFGWKRALVSVVAPIMAAADVWALSVILSSIVKVSVYLGSVIVGAMLLTYLYTLIIFAAKKDAEKENKLNVIACIVAVACAAVTACCGLSVINVMLPALFAAVFAYVMAKYMAEPHWGLTEKKSI